MVQTSNLISRAGKKAKWFRLRICFFPAREKAKWFRLRICFFPGREKAKRFRLPICFFPGREKAKWPDFQFAFSRAGKKQNGSDFQFAFSRLGKKKNETPSNLESNLWGEIAFSGLETSSGEIRTRNLLLMSLAPYPLGHSSLQNFLFSGCPKANWMSNLPFPVAFSRPGKKQNGLDFQLAFSQARKKAKWSRLPTKPFSFWCVFGWAQPSMNKRRLSQASLLRLPICFFPGREKAKWFGLPICFSQAWKKQKAQTSNLLFPGPGKSNRKSEEQLFLQRGQVTNMTCADLSQDLREPFATAVRAQSKSAFEIRLLTRKRWVFERRSYIIYVYITYSI